VKLLLDTQALIWFAENNPRLTANASSLIEDPANQVFYSAATIWEMAIKHGLGKLPLKKPLNESFRMVLEGNGLNFLPITFDHAAGVALLPRHHADPFDRLLIAQAQIEGMRPVSSDEAWDKYSLNRLW
jgi:PIN domain nuclease of toxin-antitoxin system